MENTLIQINMFLFLSNNFLKMTFHFQVKPVRLSSVDVEKVTFPTDFKSPTPHKDLARHAAQDSQAPFSSRLEISNSQAPYSSGLEISNSQAPFSSGLEPQAPYSSRLEISERVFPQLPLVHWVQDNSSPPPR